jgi:hypothetical protein
MTVAATLACPPTVGRLTRTAQAADGQSCGYAGRNGEDVSLRRIALNGQPAAAGLPSIEAELRPLVPERQGPDPIAIGNGAGGDNARVDLPGIHVNAQGDQAEVHVFGVTVHAKGDNADVDLGQGEKSTSVQAGLNGAEVRVRDVGATNAQLAYVLAADRPGPSGYLAVGYLARGPAAGPLVAAVFKAREGRQDWRGDRDINRLLRLNVKPSAPG